MTLRRWRKTRSDEEEEASALRVWATAWIWSESEEREERWRRYSSEGAKGRGQEMCAVEAAAKRAGRRAGGGEGSIGA